MTPEESKRLFQLLEKSKRVIDDELNLQIRKALRKRGIEPVNSVIKRITKVNTKQNPLLSLFYLNYKKESETLLLSFEVKMFDSQKLTTETIIFE